ncbi:MAG: hypothetical protein Q7U08_06970 [Flavobacteriaceae bacterium]|nr:hypothetical protein [Flavobacteriaceae bacterium]
METILESIFQDFLWAGVKRLGAFFRWAVLRKKYTYEQILKKDWNGGIGLLFIAFIVGVVFICVKTCG